MPNYSITYLLLYYAVVLTPSAILYKNRNRPATSVEYKCAVFVAWFLPSLLYGLRYGVGADWYTYRWYYEIVQTNTFIKPKANSLEVGYYYLSFLCKLLGMSFHGFSFVCCVVIEICILRALQLLDLKEEQWLGYFVAAFSIYFVAYNIVRQMIAAAILLLAYAYYCRRSKKRAFILFLLAISFHKSAIIGLVMFAVKELSKKKTKLGKYNILIVSIFASFAILLLAKPLIGLIQRAGYYEKYSIRSFNAKDMLYLLYYIPEWILVYFYIGRRRNKFLNECFCVFMFSCVFQTLGAAYEYFDRLAWYFISFRVFLYPMILQELAGERKRQFGLLSVSWFLLYFFVTGFIMNGNGIFPYIWLGKNV